MLFRKSLRRKLILLVIVILLFVYWRGIKQVTADNGLVCQYHVAYAFCKSKDGRDAKLPGILEVLKAGVKF